MSLVELINAMEDAGTVDIRGATLVPWALRVLESGKHKPHGRARARRSRRCTPGSTTAPTGVTATTTAPTMQAEAVKDMDAWYPLWVEGEFKPTLGSALRHLRRSASTMRPGRSAPPSTPTSTATSTRTSARRCGAKVKAPYSRVYCGKGKLGSCRKMLRKTLIEATRTGFEDLYGTSGCTLNNGTEASPQMCHDAVNPTDITAAPVGQFHWINRPTFQQAVQYTDGR